MAKETFYFSHDFGSRNDPKLQKVLMVLKQEGKGVYWDLVEMLYEESGYLLLDEIESYSFALRTTPDLIKKLISDFDLFKSDEKRFWSDSVLVRLKKRKDKVVKAKKSAKARWEKVSKVCVRIPNALQTHSDRNAIKERKGKERKGKEKVVFEKAQDFSPDDKIKFLGFQSWIVRNAPNVSKMKEPFSIEQYAKLKNDFNPQQVQVMLLKMHNYKPLIQKNISAYLTFLNWSKKDFNVEIPAALPDTKKLSQAVKEIQHGINNEQKQAS